MYMAYVKSKRMGSKKRRVRKTRRIKGGTNTGGGNPIEEVITMLDNAKQILGSMKTNSTEPSPPSPAGASAESPGNQV
jgi:hypothetical protein